MFPRTKADLAGTVPPEKLHEETVPVNKSRRWGREAESVGGRQSPREGLSIFNTPPPECHLCLHFRVSTSSLASISLLTRNVLRCGIRNSLAVHPLNLFLLIDSALWC